MQIIGRKNRSRSTFIRQNRFQNKESDQRQKTLHYDKGVSPTRGYNHYKYLCIQNRSTYICETNTNRIKGGNRIQCIHFKRLQYTTHSKGQINQTENKETEAL